MKTIAIIPAYNEEKNILKLVNDLQNYIDNILIVDDCSTDKTLEKIKQKKVIKLLVNNQNMGKGYSIRKGLNFAVKNKYGLVILLDGDGQHDPHEINNFLRESEKYDLVIGNRMHDCSNMPIVRYLTNKLDSFIVSKLIGFKINDVHCGYRAIKTELVNKLKLSTNRFEIEVEMIIKAINKNAKIRNLNTKCIYHNQKSSINPFTDTYRFIKLIVKNLKWQH